MIEIITEYFSNVFNKDKAIEQARVSTDEQIVNGSYQATNLQINTDMRINGQAVLGEDVLVQKRMIVNGRLITQHSNFLSDFDLLSMNLLS